MPSITLLSLPPYFADLDPSKVYVVFELSPTIVNFRYLLTDDVATGDSMAGETIALVSPLTWYVKRSYCMCLTILAS